MEKSRLVFKENSSLIPVKMGDSRVRSSVKVGDRVFTRVGNDLVCFKESGGRYMKTKTFDNVFKSPDVGKYFPWTVIESGNKQTVLVVREKEGLSLYKIEKSGVTNIKIQKSDSLIGDFDENDLNEMKYVQSKSSEGSMLVVSLEEENVMFECIDKDLRSIKIVDYTGTGEVFAEFNDSQYDFFAIRKKKGFVGLQLKSDKIKEEVIAKKFRDMIPESPKKVFVVQINASKFYLFASNLGLYVYKFSGDVLDLLCFDQNFSTEKGWTDAHWNAVQVVKDNGKAFLIFTGPNGIAAYGVSENCASEVPFESSIPLDMKHGAVLGATLKRDQLTLLVNNGTVIDSVVVAIEKVPARVVPKQQEIKPPNYASMVTLDRSIQQRVLQQPITKRSLWLGETLDTSSIATGVDRTTGRLSFQLPIIDLRAKFGVPIRHSFYYDQPDVDPEAVGVLGVGHWTRSVDFIYVDRKDGVFEEDFEYFLVSDKTKVRLEWVRSGDRREHFAFNGTEVVYHKDRGEAGRWEIKLRDVTCTYGEDERAVRWTLGWPNWNGKGSDRDSVVRRPLEWYLSKTSMNKGGSEVRYSYESDMVVVKGLVSYTKAIVLKQIEDTSEDVKVEFNFRKVVSGVKSDNDNLSTNFEDSFQLSGFNVETAKYFQNITIKYNQDQTLKEIVDKGKAILKLEYANYKITNIVMPSGETHAYNYKEISIKSQQVEKRFSDGSFVYSGPTYTLVANINHNKTINIQALDINASDDLARNVLVDPINLKENIKSLNVLTQSQYFVVIARSESTTAVVPHVKHKESWKQHKEQSYHKLVDFVAYDGYWMLVHRGKDQKFKLSIFELNSSLTDFKRVEQELKAKDHLGVTFISRGIVYFSDSGIFMHRFSAKENTFVERTLKSGDFTAKTISLVEKFNILSYPRETKESLQKYKDDLLDSLIRGGIAMVNNFLTVRELSLNNGKFETFLHTFILQDVYTLVEDQSKEHKLIGLDLNSWTLNLKVNLQGYDNTEHHYGFKFVNNKNKWELSIDKHDAYVTDKKEYNPYVLGYLKLPIDFEQFQLFRAGDEVVYGTKKISFDGRQIQLKDVDKSDITLEKINLKITKAIHLTKESKNANIKLKGPKFTKNLDITRLDHVLFKLPFYLAYKKGDKYKVLTLRNTGSELGNALDIQGSVLKQSTGRLLITRQVDNSKNETVIIPLRALDQHSHFKTSVIVAEQQGPSKNKYEFDTNSAVILGSSVAFKVVKMYPGVDYGYFEQTTNFVDQTRTVRVFDAENKIVAENYKGEQEKRDKAPRLNECCVLFDKFGINPIVDFYPYKLDSQQVDFIGFEKYENLKRNHWNINESKVIRGNFAGTGNSYYKLKSSDTLEGSYVVPNLKQPFVVSSWIRVDKGLSVGSETDTLTVRVHQRSFKGVIKDQINEWFYVEALLNQEATPQGSQSVKVTFSSTNFEFLDIDHVRFSPLDFNFEATVYDETSAKPIGFLRNNGRAAQVLYDYLGRKIGEIDENGNVVKLLTYSKLFGIGKLQVQSMVQIYPSMGFLEAMSPYTLRQIWEIDNGLKFSSKRVVFNNPSKMKLKKLLTDCSSAGIRFMFQNNNHKSLKITFGVGDAPVVIQEIQGEAVILRYSKFYSVWINGNLIKDHKLQWTGSKQLSIEGSNDVELRDLIVMKDFDLLVEYSDTKGHPLQQISVEDSNNLLIRGFSYDSLGRKTVESVWSRIVINALSNQVLHYRSNFIIDSNGVVSGSLVTSTASEYQQYPFTTTQYLKCPLEIRTKVGFPGKENNINSKRAISFSKSSNSNFLQLLFPPSNGFRYEVKHLPNGAINTIVMDNRDLKVAEYVAVPGYDHILTTYGYDEAGNLEEVLPPNFHQHARTLQATEDLQTFLRKHESTRSKWRVLKRYNADLQITSKETPDAGKYEFLHNERKQLRFLVHYDVKSTVDRVFYYKYTTSGEVFEFGILDTYKPTQELRQNSNKDDYPITSQNYIQFDYGETEPRSYLRGRKQTTLKVDPNGKTTETVFYGGDGEVLGRSYLHPTETNQTLDVVFGYERGNVNEVGYPVQFKGTKLVISYTHNLKGQVVAIGTPTDPMHFAKIEHTPRGKVQKVVYLPRSEKDKFEQVYGYDPAGNMIKIDSSYLTETLDYAKGSGYNRDNEGDGSILRTTFKAKWHSKGNQNLLRMTTDDLVESDSRILKATECFKKLKELGYIDDNFKAIRTLNTEDPRSECLKGRLLKKISALLLKKGYPRKYGHAYDYGSHGEMTVARYFTNEEDPSTRIQISTVGSIANPSPGDVQSFDIDPNGNHKKFYTGYQRFELQYQPFTNKIESVKQDTSNAMNIRYNSVGNIIQADHKNIISIEYDHLVDRASRITLKDGTTVQLGYDIRGERNVKKVVTASGKRTETYYIRDDKGRCLVDIKVVHLTRNAKPMFTLTSYVYGPLGLVGFIRNDAYYSVISDHEGSTRLVVKNGEVVAAYDYLPYGQRLRFYNTDPDGHVAYQYTGQEFDEETGLYNYHARLYDPELGRFYQTDPQDQYPSPYKYAGNSPVMMVDPDGEFALMIACIVFAIVGSYLGAASVNQSWNPLAWNWKSGHTYLGMFSGAVAGAVLPIGGVASFGYFSALGGATFASFATASVALAGAYLGMAGAANDWNPAQWDFTSPALYSGMLSGISVAVNIPSGSVGIARTLTSYTGKAQYGYMAFVIGGSIGFGYLAGSFANNMTFNPMKWQWNARTIVALMEGGSTILMGTSATMKHGPRKQFFELAPPTRPQPAFRRMPEIYEHFHKAVLDDKALWVFKQAKQSAKEIMKHREPLGHYVRGPPGVTLVQIAEFVSPARQLAGNVLSISYMVKEYSEYQKMFNDLGTASPKVRSKRSDENATSGCSRASFSNRMLSYLSSLWNFNDSNKRQTSDNIHSVAFTHSEQRQPHSLKTFSFQNCVPTNSDISSYTCYQSTAKVEVFPKEPTGPRAPHSVVPMDGCAPFHWYGRPAIGCEGQDFAFIYTPYETPKWFSFLDGWLLLVRVGVQIVGDLKLRGCDAERKVSCSEFELAEYGKQLSRIDDILKRNGEVEFDWAKKQLDEMREDLKQYLSGEKISAYVKMIFEEKIEALKEDILDQIANGFEFLRKC
ncbi:uncharacterized protein LOC120426919 [Culex pipiens pallens]|uniref:uncharacterized protein LOC120426919 n=1 Tax=Culex pipiens pallens TaxID=42434 RepID=UPI0019535930|nr:uncharacterized protein LOC120426919 [Culex pipiens pallens]